MSECVGCQREKLKELHTGQKVCSYCPEWMLETEAMELLEKPLKQRQRLLLIFEAARPEHVKILKQRLTEIHSHRKALQKGQLSL